MNTIGQSVLFSRKIKCAHCGKNFKAKKERGKRKYVCSNYDNYGKCERNSVEQDMFVRLLKKRYGEDISSEFIIENVQQIECTNKNTFKIILNNGDDPIEFGDKFIVF